MISAPARNVVLVSIAILFATLAGAYCIVWYSQGHALKNSIKEAIDGINAKQPYITYSAIEVSGFPSTVNVTLVKPHFKGRIDGILKPIGERAAKATPPQPNPFVSMPAWDEDDLLDGNIIFSISAYSDLFSVAINGNWQEITKIGDKTLTTFHQQTGNTSCVLQMQRGGLIGTLWDYQALTRDGQSFFKNFRSADCNHAGDTNTDPLTKDKISSSGPIRFFIGNTPSPDSYQLRFYTKAADMEVTPQGDVMLAEYFNALSPNYPYPIHFSEYGKQNVEIDLSYTGPLDMKDGDLNPTMNITLSKFDITNDINTHHMNFLFDNATNAGKRTAKLNFRAESAFSEVYDTQLQGMLRGLLQNIHDSKDPQFHDLQARFQNYTPDQLYSIIYPSLFSFHALGNAVEAVDADYVGTPDLATGDATLKNFQLSSATYALRATGSAKIAQKIPQSGTVTLTCGNCLNMVDDINAYCARLQKTISYFAPEKTPAALTITPERAEGVKKFLSVLASSATDAADPTTLHFTLVSDPVSGISINGRLISDVVAMWKEYAASTDAAQPPVAVTH